MTGETCQSYGSYGYNICTTFLWGIKFDTCPKKNDRMILRTPILRIRIPRNLVTQPGLSQKIRANINNICIKWDEQIHLNQSSHQLSWEAHVFSHWLKYLFFHFWNSRPDNLASILSGIFFDILANFKPQTTLRRKLEGWISPMTLLVTMQNSKHQNPKAPCFTWCFLCWISIACWRHV